MHAMPLKDRAARSLLESTEVEELCVSSCAARKTKLPAACVAESQEVGSKEGGGSCGLVTAPRLTQTAGLDKLSARNPR